MKIDKTWALFLDRDGIINKRLIDDYVKNPGEFEFLPGAKESIAKLSRVFGRVFIVTNQRGIARELMTTADYHAVNDFMLSAIAKAGGRIDGVYFCPHDRDDGCGCRKPAIGLALAAKREFPEIDFSRSIMAGDSDSDIEFGRRAGMVTVRIAAEQSEGLHVKSLSELAEMCTSLIGG
jgi:histidinol-phosphate phosphatase family protein